MRLQRIKTYFFGLLIVATLFFTITESIRILIVFQKVNYAARDGLRTAISGAYEPEYCAAPCEYYSAEEDAATLKTVQERIRQSLDEVPFHFEGSDKSWHSVVCSDRKGYSFDAAASKCLPEEDAGEDGGAVLVEVTYRYPFGYSLGLHIISIPIRVQLQGINECFLLACAGSFSIVFNGHKPQEYTVEVTDENGHRRVVECTVEKMDNECTDRGVAFSEAEQDAFAPVKASIVVKWAGGSKMVYAEPEYRTRYPNGPRCRTKCTSASVTVDLP
jgi:hypothetical protein